MNNLRHDGGGREEEGAGLYGVHEGGGESHGPSLQWSDGVVVHDWVRKGCKGNAEG